MELKIQKWGNSAAVRLPVDLLRKYGLHDGDLLEVEEEPSKLILKPVPAKPKYTLEQLLSQCDPDAPEPEDLKAWRDLEPVGREE
ncbi:AbrB/MazE/SpoVT family DNA-binding domain-containing protein [Halomonas sp. THAF12]|uniref:AbrB/MazE/SpoVT family DNA-binding domain-containing protein n=1 Tax=Halomonas sp. B23F22_10 TaxID=3459515 RepID=UPI00373E5D35